MFKLLPPAVEAFHNFKCGEIFCLTPTNYRVSCCMCGKNLLFDEFPQHFQYQHLSQEERNSYSESCDTTDDTSASDPRTTPSQLDLSDVQFEFCVDGDLSNLETEDQHHIEFTEDLLPKEDDENENSLGSEGVLDFELVDFSMVNDPNLRTEYIIEKVSSDEFDQATSEKNDPTKLDGSHFICMHCGRFYKTKNGLHHHLRANHLNNNENDIQNSNLEHKCKECDQVFEYSSALRIHMAKHNNCFCDICGKSFSCAGNMKTHRKRHTGVKAFKCQVCDKSFYTKKEMESHLMRHTGALPVICEICGRGCRDKGKLKAHMRRHTGERPAACEKCGKSFYSFHDLNVHSVTHSSERPFICNICDSTFQTKKSLRIHKRHHSSQRRHECKICGKTFMQAGSLKNHIRKIHP